MKRHGPLTLPAHWLAMSLAALFVVASSLAVAQEAPPPHKSPRVPVNRQALADSKTPTLQSRDVMGPPSIIDGDHLRINTIDIRLFGVVPPQLSASFGPQARAVLDEVTRGQNIECRIRDRDHDGRFLATCYNAAKSDLALELLKRGLAVAARGSVQPTDLAAPYEAAEEAAQAQKLGLWSVLPPSAAVIPATPLPAPRTDNPNLPPLPAELKKEGKPPLAPEKPASVTSPSASAAASAKLSAADIADQVQATLPPVSVPAASLEDDNSDAPGFFARYQLLITGLVMLATALGIMLVLAVERRKDRRDEMKAIAAALRGELLSARAVCLARLKIWTEADEKNGAWPRIRSTLYQAYVGRLGWLGAVLARQIASIYGQASDYASYFNPNNSGESRNTEPASKHQALQTLVQHIEEVLPRLAFIEQNGMRPKGRTITKAQSATPSSPPDAPVAQGGDVAAYAAHPPAEVTATTPLWDLAKIFTRGNPFAKKAPVEEAITDYTALIEEEIARMSYETESTPPPPSNVRRIKTGS